MIFRFLVGPVLVQRLRIMTRLAHTLGVMLTLGIRCCMQKPSSAPVLLADCFDRLGATYVKLGQFVASSPSVFPRPYVNACHRFLDRAESVPFEALERVLKREWGSRFAQAFQRIDPTPLASASVAQVHLATLASGEEVVLKILKPGVRELLRVDLLILRIVTRFLLWRKPVLQRAGILEILREMEDTVANECDFLIESGRIRCFGRFLQKNGITQVIVPKVYPDLTTQRVLVMEHLRGLLLSTVTDDQKAGICVAQALRRVMRVWLISVTSCEFFHADMHPGNIILLEDGRIGLIDFGIVGTVEPKFWQSVLSLLDGLQRYNPAKAARAIVEIGSDSDHIDLDAVARDLGALLERPRQRRSGERKRVTDTQEIVLGIAALGEKHDLRFPRELFLLLKQYVYFDFTTAILAELETQPGRYRDGNTRLF